MSERSFVVRNKRSPEQFAGKTGWSQFRQATVFGFTSEDAMKRFLVGMEPNQELCEIELKPVRAIN